MAQQIINGEVPFKVHKDNAIIGPSASGYTLAYGVSKDGTFTEYPTPVPAGENLILNGLAQYSWLKLVGNEGEVEAIL